MGRGALLIQTSAQNFEHFLAPGIPGREWGRIDCVLKMRANKRFVQREENARLQGLEGSP